MSAALVSPSPKSAPISAALQVNSRPHTMWHARAWRPQGTSDWLMLYTLEGEADLRADGREFLLNPGSAILIAPHTPQDYGLTSEEGFWKNIWIHFRARSDWLVHLKWPEIACGTGQMFYPIDIRENVEARLHDIVRQFQGPSAIALDLAMNTLEHVLLVTSDINPARSDGVRDKRIRHAAQLICDTLTQPIVIADVARTVGLSRTRFSVLFHDSFGYSPQDYVEIKRLERVAHLLEHSTLQLAGIAAQTGFSCPFYLSRRFARRYQMTPSDFRSVVQRHGPDRTRPNRPIA
jgi:AraC family transcriptional regulator, arabinose operon regulatory protein